MRFLRILLMVSLFCANSLAQSSNPDRLSGAFLQFSRMSPGNISDYLDEQLANEIRNITTIGLMTCSPTGANAYIWNEPGNPYLIGYLLEEASKRGMHVNLGLLATENCNQANDTAQAVWLVSYILSQWGDQPALAGWYIGDEPYLMDSSWLSWEMQYYVDQVAAIRKLSSLPISVSPYLVSNWPGTPADAAKAARIFVTATKVDVLLYEDGMGGRRKSGDGYLGWNTPPTSADYFAAISQAIGPEHLGVVHELFNPTFGIDGGHMAVATTRLNQQIEMVPDALLKPGARYTWTNQDLMSAVSPTAWPDAARLLAGYRATHGMGGRMLHPTHVNWWTPTDTYEVVPGLPDYSSRCQTAYGSLKLIDGVIGDPFSMTWDWAGTPESATICIDLGTVQTVDWVSLHVGQVVAENIRIPRSVTLSGSVDGGNWWQLAPARLITASETMDGETVIGNATRMGVQIRYIWVFLDNGPFSGPSRKTRVSEIEVIGR